MSGSSRAARRPALVTTTIHVPEALEAYAADAVRSGHRDALFVVVGDRGTPPEAGAWCRRLAAASGLEVRYLGVEDQEDYLGAYPELRAHLPWTSIQRRTVGMLLAYQEGCDPIITVDDDNHRVDDDFIGTHQLAGRVATLPALVTDSGWVNVCSFLVEARGRDFYHRGHPLGQRWRDERVRETGFTGLVAVNAGLWLGDPDVDAIQRLTCPVDAVEFRGAGSFALGPGTWSPFNSQNTALTRDAVAAYFLSPCIGRYDDIWASYVVCAIAQHLGHAVAFGRPLVRQERNQHDLWRDLEQEAGPMRATDALWPFLKRLPLTGADYRGCAIEVCGALRAWLADDARSDLPPEARRLFADFTTGLETWTTCIARADRGP